MNPLYDTRKQFSFNRRCQPIDWRKIASIDIAKLSQEFDFKVIQDNVTNITLCNIEAEVDLSKVDSNYIKLFKLAQLIIEYLMQSQGCLSDLINSKEDSLAHALKENQKLVKELNKNKELVLKLQKENRKRRLMLENQQKSLNDTPLFPCHICGKIMMDARYLKMHMERRHKDSKTDNPDNDVDVLKLKCNDIEKRLQDEKDSYQVLLKKEREGISFIEQTVQSAIENMKLEVNNNIKPLCKNLEENMLQQISNLREEQINKRNESEGFIRDLISQQIEQVQQKSSDEYQTLINKTSRNSLEEMESVVKECLEKYKMNMHKQFEDQFNKSKQDLKKFKMKNVNEIENLKADVLEYKKNFQLFLELQEHSKKKKDISKSLANKPTKIKMVEIDKEMEKSPRKSSNESVKDSDPSSYSKEDSVKSSVQGFIDSRKVSLFPRAIQTSKSEPDLIHTLKFEMHKLVEDRLKDTGINSNVNKLSRKVYEDKILELKHARKSYSERFDTFNDIRLKLLDEVNERLESQMKSPKLQKHMNEDISDFSSPKSSSVKQLTKKQEILDDFHNSVEAISKATPIPVPRTSRAILTSTVRTGIDSQNNSLDISLSDLSDIKKPKGLSSEKSISDGESDWDSISDIEALPDDTDAVIKLKKPSGSKVEILAKSIENQLSQRKDKPVGGVDLAETTTKSKPFSMSMQNNVDDDDELDLSSLSFSDISGTHARARQSSLKSGSDLTSVWGSSTS